MPDDTLAIQNRLNSADSFGIVYLPPGTYQVAPLNVPASVRYLLPDPTLGTVLKFAANRGKFDRLLNVRRPGALYIGGISFDMSRDEQGPVSNETTGHQAAIFLENCEAMIRDVLIQESAGNGIHVYNGASVDIADTETEECFRGGLTVSGNLNSTTASKSRFDYVNIEEKIATAKLDVDFDNVTCGTLESTLTPLSKFVADNVRVDKRLMVSSPAGCSCLLRDSQFSGFAQFQLPNATVENCSFNAAPGTTGQVVSVQWRDQKNMTLLMRGCKVNGVGGASGIDANTDDPANGNLLSLDGVAFTKVRIPVVAKRKGNWAITGCTKDGVSWP